MRFKNVATGVAAVLAAFSGVSISMSPLSAMGENPVFDGWYADPEGGIYDDIYWIFPTWSDDLRALVPFDDGEIYQEVIYFRFTFRPFQTSRQDIATGCRDRHRGRSSFRYEYSRHK